MRMLSVCLVAAGAMLSLGSGSQGSPHLGRSRVPTSIGLLWWAMNGGAGA